MISLVPHPAISFVLCILFGILAIVFYFGSRKRRIRYQKTILTILALVSVAYLILFFVGGELIREMAVKRLEQIRLEKEEESK